MTSDRPREDSVVGCILGTAIGDAIGLYCEGMSKQRQRKVYGEVKGHRFLFGRGMISDDTEHTCMVAQALIVSGGDIQEFTKSLAWRFRFWLLGFPAGMGKATLRALLKLWIGFPGSRSGVFSAGNGPAMRSAVIGSCHDEDIGRLRELVKASTRITHTDPKAEFGAMAVALAAHMASNSSGESVSPQTYYDRLRDILKEESADEFLKLIDKAVKSVTHQETTKSFAADLGLGAGISGYVYHTVPIVLHSWLRHQGDYRSAIVSVVQCGGDTDTTAAIVGGIVGAGVGKVGIPQEWLDGLWEWPRTVGWMQKLGEKLAVVSAQDTKQRALRLPVYGLLVRNALFFLVVLIHGLRRLLPPY